jgi:hypothetical protein
MKTITQQIAERLEELAVEWRSNQSECAILFRAAEIVAKEFSEKEKEQIKSAINLGGEYDEKWDRIAEQYYNETFDTKWQ